VLDRLLEPDEARRTLVCRRAVEILQTGECPDDGGKAEDPPYGSRIRLRRADGALELTIPERGDARVGLTLLGFSAFWLLFVGFWTVMSRAMGAPILFSLFSIPFWIVGFAMLRRGLRSFVGRTFLHLSGDGLQFRRRLLFPGRITTIPLQAIGTVGIQRSTAWQVNTPGARAGTPQVLSIQAGAKSLSFGESLSDPEKKWLRDTIRREVEGLRG
jgi:hypothetical protein